MRNNEKNARPEFVTSTLELYNELFTIHPLGQAQEDLDFVFKKVMLTSDEEIPLLNKQTFWETYRCMKIIFRSFEKCETPEHIFEVEIEL
jgi:hypothetical protein